MKGERKIERERERERERTEGREKVQHNLIEKLGQKVKGPTNEKMKMCRFQLIPLLFYFVTSF